MCVSGNMGDDDDGVGGDILNILINKAQQSTMIERPKYDDLCSENTQNH